MNRPDNLTVWRSINGLLVSQYGAVIGKKGRLVNQIPNNGRKRRYLAIGIWIPKGVAADLTPKHGRVKKIAVHRLVAECFISRKRRFCGYSCDHIDNNPNDNSIFNLQAVSRSYNSRKGNRTIIQTKLHYYVRNNDSALG
ncbi:MAG: HNH endonuclease [Paludibacteraceae bacterium]|nr:HNH endonuclease [Paludibacteraceae bacterium]